MLPGARTSDVFRSSPVDILTTHPSRPHLIFMRRSSSLRSSQSSESPQLPTTPCSSHRGAMSSFSSSSSSFLEDVVVPAGLRIKSVQRVLSDDRRSRDTATRKPNDLDLYYLRCRRGSEYARPRPVRISGTHTGGGGDGGTLRHDHRHVDDARMSWSVAAAAVQDEEEDEEDAEEEEDNHAQEPQDFTARDIVSLERLRKDTKRRKDSFSGRLREPERTWRTSREVAIH